MRRFILSAVILIAFALRLLLIYQVEWNNNADLKNYVWDAARVLEESNPYTLWRENPTSGFRADMLPMELAVLSVVGLVDASPNTFRTFFALCDLAAMILLAVLYRSDFRRQLLWVTLYGFGLGPLYAFTLTPGDKPLLFALIVAIFVLAKSSHRFDRWSSALGLGLLAALKWLGAVFALPILYTVSERNRRVFVGLCAVAAGIFLISHTLWFPSWRIVYAFRESRMHLEPFHTGIAVVLQAIGLPMPRLYTLLLVISWAAVNLAWWRKWIGWEQAAALSLWAFVYWAPDTGPHMLLLAALVLLLSINWSAWPRVAAVWVGMTFVTAVFAGAVYPLIGGPVNLASLAAVVGAYGGGRVALLSQFFVWLCLFWIGKDALQRALASSTPRARQTMTAPHAQT